MSVHTVALMLFVLASFVLLGGIVAWEIERHTYVEQPLPRVDFVKVLITVDSSQFRAGIERLSVSLRKLGETTGMSASAFTNFARLAREAARRAEEERRVREHNKLIGYDPDEWAMRHYYGGDDQ